MPLHRIPLKIIVFLAFLITITLKIFHLSFPMTILAPCCVIALYRLPRLQASFFCLAIGFFIDTLTLTPTAGLYAASFTFASYLLHPLTYYFFPDKLSTLPLMTVIFSSLTAASIGLGHSLIHTPFHHTLLWIHYDLFLYPLIDGAVAFTAVQGSILLWKRMQKKALAYE